ncbi:hypothetical protein D3C87_1202000 [compost metagenome]
MPFCLEFRYQSNLVGLPRFAFWHFEDNFDNRLFPYVKQRANPIRGMVFSLVRLSFADMSRQSCFWIRGFAYVPYFTLRAKQCVYVIGHLALPLNDKKPVQGILYRL